MCGIVGYIGQNPEKQLIDKLKRLEYRGYDSAGIAVEYKDVIEIFKAKGEIKNLENVVCPLSNANLGIGHTRWATHGKPDETNAHPHVSSDNSWVVVHNGIIENYSELKENLIKKGYDFYSETDTEVIAKLLEYYSKNKNGLDAVKETCSALKGSFALAILNKGKNKIYFAKNKSPLYISNDENQVMIASDIICFKGFSGNYYPLSDGVYGYADENGVEFFNELGATKIKAVDLSLDEYDNLNTYKHFMIKEIYETKNSIKNIIEYYSDDLNQKKFDKFNLSKINKIKLVGCGTAYHAALMGSKIFEQKLGIECNAYVASEFRYSNSNFGEDTMVVLISQSGETADTLGAFELAKERGALTVALVNVEYSTLAKRADVFFPIKAGVEVAVASTKAYSAQLVVLNIIAEIINCKLTISSFNMSDIIDLYNNLDYGRINDYKLLADALRFNDRLFMIGRGVDYYTALEASLKIKETSYINTDTYYAGELKHGFLALIDLGTYVIVFATEKNLLSKTLANAEEARARGAKVILFTCFDLEPSQTENFFYVIKVLELNNPLQCVINILPWQIIAYYTSVSKGLNPDRPRNLAKSVTVE